MKYLTPCLNLKSINDEGEISGYASVFNVVDGYNEIVVKNAFKTAIENFKKGKIPKLLWQHDVNFPIGIITEMVEDDHGLFIKFKLLQEITKAKEIYYLLKNKAIDGLSIGYRLKNSYYKNNYKFLTDIDLLEISIVTFPACEQATVESVTIDISNKSISVRNL